MPRYDYRCDEDGLLMETIFPMGEAPAEMVCSDCGGPARRVFHPPAAIHFKGSGFYTTDVTSKLHRKRRPNPGDSLHKEYDDAGAKIARAL